MDRDVGGRSRRQRRRGSESQRLQAGDGGRALDVGTPPRPRRAVPHHPRVLSRGSPRCARRDSRGFTLTEVTVVIVLAGVVTSGWWASISTLQAMWMDASTQALAQRDATSILEYMRQHGHGRRAPCGCVQPQGDILRSTGATRGAGQLRLNATDSLVYHGIGRDDTPDGPVAPTVVEEFAVTVDPTYGLVSVDTLRVRSTSGVTGDDVDHDRALQPMKPAAASWPTSERGFVLPGVVMFVIVLTILGLSLFTPRATRRSS